MPSMQVGNEPDFNGKEKVLCMPAQVEATDLPRRFHEGSRDPDLSRIDEWEPQI